MNLGEFKLLIENIEYNNDEALVVFRDEFGVMYQPHKVFVEYHEDTHDQTFWVDMDEI